MRKRIFERAAAVMLGLLLSGVPLPAGAEEETALWQYNDYGDGTVSITCLDKTVTEVEVPAEMDGKTITMIEVDCFNGCEQLKKVTLPETITVLDDYAFYRCGALEELNIPAHLEKIGFQTFYGCAKLPEMTVPETVTEIEAFAFEGCNALGAVDVADANAAYKDEDGVLFTKDGSCLMLYPSAKTDASYVVPGGCQKIDDRAFIGNTHLENVDISAISELGEDAFYYCTALKEIAIPAGITSLNGHVFGNCNALEKVTLPEGITSLGNSCFYNCASLQGITLPQSLTTIEDNCFYGCVHLASIDIPDAVTDIGKYAFFNCASLHRIALSANVQSVGDYALGFYSEDGENSLRLPDFEVEADNDTAAFAYCVKFEIRSTGGVTQSVVFLYIILGVVVLVIAATIAIIVIQRRIRKRYELN